jgi:hypothetical protein
MALNASWERGAPRPCGTRCLVNGGMPPETDPALLAEHHLGDVPTVAVDGRETVMHLGRVSTTGGFDTPGEFDLPPEEPVVLVGEIPWELRAAE